MSAVCLLCFLFLCACTREPVGPQVRELTASERKTVQQSTDFAFDAFRRLNAFKPADKNQFISPFSLAMAVAMTANGADGTTKEGMYQTLGMQALSDQQINQSFQSLSQYLNGIDPTVRFQPANSIWYRQELTPQTAFVQTNQTYFDALVKGLDFTDSEATKNTINAWVKDKTEGKIEKIVDKVSGDHQMFLLNAIYFDGTWTYQFDKSLTKPADFMVSGNTTVRADFMKTQGVMSYLADAEKVLVNVPYGNKQFEMTLIMPQGEKALDPLLTGLDAETFANWQSQTQTDSVQLLLPKFRFEGDYTQREFNTVLSDMGMEEAFSNTANFSRLFEGSSRNLKIDEVAHKTFVQVDEKGTEAAAVTVVSVVFRSSSAPKVPPLFYFNRPFLYLIREKNSGAILFMGKMMNPTVEK
jgi:serpin B